MPRGDELIKIASCLSLAVASVLAAGCGSNESTSAGERPSGSAPADATSDAPPLVGRWRRVNECPQLVNALRRAGLAKIAPAVVGDYFPGTPPKRLAREGDLCKGAKSIVHYHFFDEGGRFGSLDENEEQVDDGTYEVIDESTFVISKEFPDTTFHYEIKGDAMTLTPVLTRAMKNEALRHPFAFSVAGWAVSVSYPGHEWKRVDCAGWC